MALPRVTLTIARLCGLGALLVPALVSVAAPAPAVPVGAPRVVATVPGTPWEIAVLPGGGAFVVERDGDIVRLDPQDQLQPTPALLRSAVPHVRKLLGLALAPDFATSGLAYLYVSQDQDPDGSGPATGSNSIWRLRATGPAPTSLTVVDQVFAGIDSDGNHDGGRMVFGPDGDLYVTTGDIHQPSRPQDVGSLNGKILRFATPSTGPLSAPADNPWAGQGGSAAYVWSRGHRHPQGLAFDAAGRLWETEHGPSGEQHGAAYPGGNGKTGRDELNLVVRGGNYGWPLVSGPDVAPGTVAPAAVAGDSPAWAPGDLAVGADGSLYAPFLAGARLHRFDVRDGAVFAAGDHVTDLGRLRVAVASGSDLLVAQDGADGGRIVRVPLGPPVPGGSDAATGATGVTGPSTTVTPSATATSTSTGRHAARRVARATTRVLSRPGARRGLLRGRALRAEARAPAGTTSVRVHLGGRRGPVLSVQRREDHEAGVLAVSVRLGPGALVLLRRAATPLLLVQVRHRTPGQPVDRATGRVRLDPRPR